MKYKVDFKRNRSDRGSKVIDLESLPDFLSVKRKEGYKKFFIKKIDKGGDGRHHYRFNSFPKRR